jgi:hypothetical protein
MLAAAAAMGTAALCGSAMAVSAAGEMNWDDSAAENAVCVAAGKDLLTACGDALDTIVTV